MLYFVRVPVLFYEDVEPDDYTKSLYKMGVTPPDDDMPEPEIYTEEVQILVNNINWIEPSMHRDGASYVIMQDNAHLHIDMDLDALKNHLWDACAAQKLAFRTLSGDGKTMEELRTEVRITQEEDQDSYE